MLRIAARLATLEAKALVARLSPFSGMHFSRDQWESQYSSGDWDRLRHIDELPHYSAIAGYVSSLVGKAAVLDVGCGEGILQETMRRSGYARYVGIDLAASAIARAASRSDDATTFECADALTYSPAGDFDAIVFNEVLYYFDAPLELMAGYSPRLQAAGVTIVSMAVSRRSLRIWKMLDKSRRPAAEVLLANRAASWVVKVYQGGF
ncbi:MAG: methyltransferase domain-containing protein [Planctomycetota bacterium]